MEEQGLLSIALSDFQVMSDLEVTLQVNDFDDKRHQIIYKALLHHQTNNLPCDLTIVSGFLKDHNVLDRCGGVEYLFELCDTYVTSGLYQEYAKKIKDRSLKRQFYAAQQKLTKLATDPDADLEHLIEEAEKNLSSFAISSNNSFETTSQIMDRINEKMLKQANSNEELSGLKTGYTLLDKITLGLQNKDLIILAARPAMGKTAFAINLLANVTRDNNINTALFSLEMPNEQLLMRLGSSDSLVSLNALKKAKMSHAEWQQFKDADDKIRKTSIYLDDTAGLTLQELKSKCRELARKKGLGLIVIDYLQLIRLANFRGNRQQEVSEITRSLKELARELNCPIIALSQLSRNVESREDKRPMMADLRESGSIEQDADIVAFLYREDYYKGTEMGNISDLELIIQKHRNGSLGTVNLKFDRPYSKIWGVM